MTEHRFANRVALILGGTSGIGRAAALRFAAEGAAVVIGGRNVGNGEDISEQICGAGGDALFARTDVGSLEQVQAIVATTLERFGRLDCAFNNAGWEGTGSATADTSESDWQRMIDIKLNGVWRGVREQIPAMLKGGGGSIVNMAGNWGLVGFPNYASYCAAAHGILGLTKAAALEYAGQGIRINAVCPGAVDAPLLDRMVGGDASIKAAFAAKLPAGRLATEEDVAEAVLWLASDAAAYVNGTSIVLDGGGKP
ncbi:MAG: SDR family oxidoreductase [Gammaproteobacteria bacterium]|nr:SDR family oxidoreductase [Gammaproteobacteria bacterium]